MKFTGFLILSCFFRVPRKLHSIEHSIQPNPPKRGLPFLSSSYVHLSNEFTVRKELLKKVRKMPRSRTERISTTMQGKNACYLLKVVSSPPPRPAFVRLFFSPTYLNLHQVESVFFSQFWHRIETDWMGNIWQVHARNASAQK